MSALTREEALELARSFGQTKAVDVWSAEDGSFRLLEIYRTRPAEPSRGDGHG